MKKILIRVVVAVIVLITIVLLGVALFLDQIVKKGVETAGPMITQVEVKLDGASVSVLGGSAKLKKFIVGNPAGYKTDCAIKVDNVSVALQPMSIFSDKVIVQTINVQAPEITLEGGLKENNLTKILDNINGASGSASSAPAQKSENKGASKKLQVTDLMITGAKVHANTILSGGQTVTVTIPDIHLQNLGTGPDGITAAELSKVVLNELINQTIPAVSKQVTAMGKDAINAAKNLGSGSTKDVEKVTSGLKGLFKK